MLFELGTMIITTLLSVTGVGLPQLSVQPTMTPAISCLAQSADTCMQSEICDVFIAASGNEVCGVACDMRTLETCSMDTNCTIVDGACDYAETSPVGC